MYYLVISVNQESGNHFIRCLAQGLLGDHSQAIAWSYSFLMT